MCKILNIIIFLIMVIPFSHNYPNNYEGSQISAKSTPVEMMVDTTNMLAFNVLYLHSISNKNNIAFSPCGLISVLVALYEGSNGKSSLEIQQALKFPWQKDIIRVGYRDIHRRLRAYFYHHENNLLSGLSLSKENVTIRSEYETLLRFYGYEVDGISFQTKSTTPYPEENSTTEVITTTEIEEETTTVEVTTTVFNETTTEVSTNQPFRTTSKSTPTTTTTETSTKIDSSTIPTTTQIPKTTMYIFTFKPPTSTKQNETTNSTPLSTITKIPAMILTTTEKIDTPSSTTRANTSTSSRRGRKIMRFTRSSMEYEISAYELTPSYFSYQATPNPQLEIEYDTKYSQTDPNEEIINHFFYINHIEMAQVRYKFYNTILKYKYFENIRSSVLELDLDSKNYKMMIILPDYDYGLNNLLIAMNNENSPSLRELKNSLIPTWIKAIVPKFNLKGNIVLTSDLQNMGIEDIFEPTHADFSKMTEEKLLYARNVEQKVTVNIRTQSIEHLKRHTTFYQSPVEVSVNHPFLFLIIDTELDLTIMAGRILNPLNSRIQ